MEKKNVKLDENWVTPSALAKQLGVVPSTVGNWIIRNQVDYMVFPENIRRKHLVDRRTAPENRKKGKRAKKK